MSNFCCSFRKERRIQLSPLPYHSRRPKGTLVAAVQQTVLGVVEELAIPNHFPQKLDFFRIEEQLLLGTRLVQKLTEKESPKKECETRARGLTEPEAIYSLI